MQYIHRDWKLALLAFAIIAIGCLGLAQRSVQAQSSVAGWPSRNFTVNKPEVVPFNTRPSVLKNGKFESDEEEQTFVKFYNQSLFPNVTNPANRQSPRDDVITRLRNDLKACEKPQDQDQQVFNKLTDLTLAYMTKVAEDGQYHPVARVNAMLAIGEINSPKAAKVLLDTAFGKGSLFAVRVAAMTGLVRMAGPIGRRKELDGQAEGVLSDPEIEPLVIKNMVSLVGFAKKRDDGFHWMRGQAADVLADLGNTGPQGEVPPALLKMLSDTDLPIPLRSKAARALGKLNYGASPPAPGPYLTALAELASAAFSSDQPADRARVRLVVRDVGDALKKFAASSTLFNSNDQALVEGLQKVLLKINKQTEDKMAPDELKNSINEAKTSLDSLLKSKQ